MFVAAACRVLIDVALEPAVVELALAVGLAAEVILELRLRGDDEHPPAVQVPDVPPEGPDEALGLALLQHPLAVGRVRDEDARLAGGGVFVASASRKSIHCSTPAFLALARAIDRLSGSRSAPRMR